MAQAQTVAIPKRWQLVQPISNRDPEATKDSRMINAYAEKDLVTDEYVVYKRVGFGAPLYSFTAAGMTPGPRLEGVGNYLWSRTTASTRIKNLIQIVGSGLGAATVYNGNTLISPPGGIIVTPGKVASFAPIASLPVPLLMFSTFNAVAYYTDGTTVTQITDSNFPGFICPGIVVLDGTIYVMDGLARIWGSKNLYDPAVWDALNVIRAGIEADGGVYLAKQLEYVVAIKENTTEFFYDAGNATGSPLAPVQGAMLNYGAFSADTVQEIEGTLLWVTSNKTVSPQVLRLDNLHHTIVSPPAIDRQLDSLSNSSVMKSFTFKHGGHRFYVLISVDLNKTWVYDLDQNLWYLWTDPYGNYFPYVSQAFDTLGNHLFQHISNGKVYPMDGDYEFPNDDGVTFPVDIYTDNFDAGVDREKQLSKMYFKGDQVSGSKLQVRVSDDDYQTWSNFREVDMSQKRAMLDDCGSFYKRAMHIRHFCDTPMRLRSVGLQMDIGTQ